MKNLGNVMILGDSYSTFEGYIPTGFAAYYSEQKGTTDVDKVTQTWWHKLLQETGSTLCLNSSWSGTTICHTGYDASDCSDKSFVARFEKLQKEEFFKKNEINTLLIFGGTNDSWADSPIGKIKYADWTKEELYQVFPAFCCLLEMAKKSLNKSRILVVINTELKNEIVEGYKEACNHYGIEFVQLENIDKMCGHPSILGMKQIKNQVLNAL